MTLNLTLVSGNREENATIEVGTGIIAGWTGRNRSAIEKHVKELEELGVKRPKFTPSFYRVSTARFTTAASIEAVGPASSGEVEFVLLRHGGQLWVGVGSDHTDREVETYDVTVSKQMCDKPISPVFWSFDDVADHWDRLTLRSYIVEGGKRTLYQEGPVTAMLDPKELMSLYRWEGKGLPENFLMFCGTHPAIGGIRPSDSFEMMLEDPVLGRNLSHRYATATLPPIAETRATA